MDDSDRKSTNCTKNVHPEARANFISRLFFCWAFTIFAKGWKQDLTEDDLYGPLKSHESRGLGEKLRKVWEKEKRLQKRPSLAKAVIKVYYGDLIFYGLFLIVQELVVKMGQPLLVSKLMGFYVPQQTTVSLEQAYLYAGGIVILSMLNSMIQNYSFFGLQHLAMKMQIACRSLIYSKALKLSRTAVAESTVGQMVNLMSNDVSRFQYICLHLHQVLIAPIQTLVVLYLLFSTVDPTAMTGVGLLILSIPALFYMGKLTSKYRFRTAIKTDQRIRLMNEIVAGVQIIKMYTWEKPFAKLVEIARKMEIGEIKANAYVRTIYMSITMIIMPSSIFLCILTYVLTGNTLQAQYVYVVTSFYGTLRQPLTLHVPRCVAMLAEINVSLNRIQTFLLNEEVESREITRSGKTGITMRNVCVKWSSSSPNNSLNDADFSISSGQLVAIVGRVGSGKTTLLQAILREIPLSEGRLEVNGTLSYASQEPWLFASSIRQNILFGEVMDWKKYKRVVQACALDKDFSAFPYGDRTVVGEKGIMLSGGQKARVSLARAIYKEADIYLLDDPLSAVDTHVGKQIFDNCIRDYLKNKSTILVTHQIQYLNHVDKIYLLENGNVAACETYQQLLQSQGDFMKLLHEKEQKDSGKEKQDDGKVEKKKSITFENSDIPKEIKEQRSVGKVSKKVYLRYFCIGGSCFNPCLVLVTFFLTQIVVSGNEYFLSFWVNLEQKRLEDRLSNSTDHESNLEMIVFTSKNLLYTYASLIFLLAFLVLMRAILFVNFSMEAAKRLHDGMFDGVVHTTLRFFNTNPSGRVLNRFSRDMGIADETVPLSLTETIQVFLNVLAITIIVSSLNPWIILPTVFIFGIFYGYKTVFLATSRDLKRIEGTARSPLFSHLTASLQGLSTIRAFDAQAILQQEFDHIQDHHSAAYYMFFACSRTFAFWLDMSCIIYVGIVILSFLFIGTETYGGNVGLAITQSISLTGMLQRGIRQWSELENQMTSVERIAEYSELEPEPDSGKRSPPKLWPELGVIELENVSLKYYKDGPYVLKKLNLIVHSKGKIGIVGRTGAGKSSLISALFRLACLEGRITIDNVDIQDIPLRDLRSAISIIPQEPVLFSGTLRKNLDPFDEYSDDDLWSALEEVELKNLVSELPAALSSNVTEGGSNFSVGERQLLCLARTIVRKNKILILDEATANVDLQTDELIQKTVRTKFQDCTVLTIAHRLQTVMDSDKIMVLDDGYLKEFDHPHLLLQNTKGLFYGFVRGTGGATAENLMKKAKENYDKSPFSVR